MPATAPSKVSAVSSEMLSTATVSVCGLAGVNISTSAGSISGLFTVYDCRVKVWGRSGLFYCGKRGQELEALLGDV